MHADEPAAIEAVPANAVSTPVSFIPYFTEPTSAAPSVLSCSTIDTHKPEAVPRLTGGRPLSTALFIEICCGTAGFTASVVQVGMDGLGIDHQGNKSRPKAPVMMSDLATPVGQNRVMELLEATQESLVWVHFAVPCGTSSRARERPVPAWLRAQGAPQPAPLRNALYPQGLPNLQGINRTRVLQANEIYSFAALAIKWLIARNIGYSFENPESAWTWKFPDLVEVWKDEKFFDALFPQCAHGGDRPARRRWRSNKEGILRLSAVCDGKHPHLAFGVKRDSSNAWQFDTAAEAAYPTVLCQRAAAIVKQEAVTVGFVDYSDVSFSEVADTGAAAKRARLKASLGGFARGNRLPQLIAEFKQTIMLPASRLPPGCVINQKVDISGCTGKVLREEIVGGDVGTHYFAVGIYWTPEEFALRAHSLQHPIDMDSVVCRQTKENAFWLLTTSDLEVAQFRLQQVAKLREWISKHGDTEDAELRKSLPPAQAGIAKRKRISALIWLCEQTGYPDQEATHLLYEGAAVTGFIEPSGVFPKKVTPPSFGVKQLEASCKWTTPATAAKMRGSGDVVMDDAVWTETLAEHGRGWIQGPEGGYSSLEDVRKALGGDFALSRRFGIRQGIKVRVIDDFSESLVNSTVGVTEKLDLQSLDESVAAIKAAIDSVGPSGEVYMVVDRGLILKGRLPRGRSTTDAKSWVGKCVDLKSAYRQIPIRPDNQWAAVIAVWCPAAMASRFFTIAALPFGSTGSVYGFNRLSRLIWAVVGKWLRLTWTNYYDDFPTYELKSTAVIADVAIRAILALLGWDLSLDKAKPFELQFAQLGAIVDLALCPQDQILVGNKPERVVSITKQLSECLETGICLSTLASELAGKCQFASSHVAGRIATGFIHVLTLHQHRSRGGRLDEDTVTAIKQLINCLGAAKPRVVDSRGDRRPILVFPDGAAEGADRGLVTMGAVILDTSTEEKVMFGDHVPEALVALWKSDGRIQTIGQCELLPILLSRLVRPGWFAGRRIFYFIDNDSARHSLIRGYSPARGSCDIVREFIRLESYEQTWSWFARIPSASNPGDGPSRLELNPSADNLFAQLVDTPKVPECLFGKST